MMCYCIYFLCTSPIKAGFKKLFWSKYFDKLLVCLYVLSDLKVYTFLTGIYTVSCKFYSVYKSIIIYLYELKL